MKSRGRPRKFSDTVTITLKMDGALKEALESYAIQHKIPKSEVIREALYFFLRAKASHYTNAKGMLRSRKL